MTNLRFREDGSFRVLQMADIQDGPNVLPDTIRLIREAIRKADPDLVVFTGDQIRGYDPAYIDTFLRRRGEEPGARVRAVTEVEAKLRGIKRRARDRVNNRLLAMKSDGSNPDAQQTASTASTASTLVYSTTSDSQDVPTTLDELMDETRDKVRRTFAGFLGPVIEAEVPFAATYGNHDFQCGILADEQDGIYREFPGCLNPVDSPEPGTFALPIEASDGSGRVAMSVMMVNSGDYAGKPEENDAQYPAYVVNPRGLDLADSDGYGTPSPEAIDWLGAVQSELGERNGDGKPVPAIAFQHIPPQEFYDCLKEVPAWTPNAVEARVPTPAIATCSTMRFAGRDRGWVRRLAVRTRTSVKWTPCVRQAATSRCSAVTITRTPSWATRMALIWATRPPADSNAMVPSRAIAASACSNSMKATRPAT